MIDVTADELTSDDLDALERYLRQLVNVDLDFIDQTTVDGRVLAERCRSAHELVVAARGLSNAADPDAQQRFRAAGERLLSLGESFPLADMRHH